MPQGLQGRQLHLAVFAIVLGITLSVIDTTAVTLGLPAMARDLGVSPDSAIWIVNGFQIAALVAWSLGLCGIGFGLFQSPNNHIIITSAPVQRSGAASGMLGSARLTGQTLGAALVAVIFAVQGTTTPRGFSAALAVAAVLAAVAAMTSTMRLKHRPGPRT